MKFISIIVVIIFVFSVISGCTSEDSTKNTEKNVPHEMRWGIYCLDLSTEDTTLIYSTDNKLTTLRLNYQFNRFVFSQRFDDSDESEEICSINIDGSDFQKLTDNNIWDLYPAWSPTGDKIAFLSLRGADLDIYVMNSDGTNQEKLLDTGSHDADINWVGDYIAFTSGSSIWRVKSNGTQLTKVTSPPRAGEWGNANLPFGDYDPYISPDGTKIAFERLEDDTSAHGNYNIYLIDVDGTNETKITNTYWSQGFATWSNNGDKILFLVAAINDEGKYDLYVMNSDGTNVRKITPSYFPADFLCYAGVFSDDDSKIYFIGEWWS
jgi:Tol biopolymer transport system component